MGSLPPCSWGLATEETGWPLHLLHAELPLSWAPSPEGIVQSRCTPVRAPPALGRGADPRLSCRSRRARREMGGPVGDSAATAKDHSALIGGLLAWPGVLRAGGHPAPRAGEPGCARGAVHIRPISCLLRRPLWVPLPESAGAPGAPAPLRDPNVEVGPGPPGEEELSQLPRHTGLGGPPPLSRQQRVCFFSSLSKCTLTFFNK